MQLMSNYVLGAVRLEVNAQWQHHWMSELSDEAPATAGGTKEGTVFETAWSGDLGLVIPIDRRLALAGHTARRASPSLRFHPERGRPEAAATPPYPASARTPTSCRSPSSTSGMLAVGMTTPSTVTSVAPHAVRFGFRIVMT